MGSSQQPLRQYLCNLAATLLLWEDPGEGGFKQEFKQFVRICTTSLLLLLWMTKEPSQVGAGFFFRELLRAAVTSHAEWEYKTELFHRYVTYCFWRRVVPPRNAMRHPPCRGIVPK